MHSNINRTDTKSVEKWREVSSNPFKYKQNWHQIRWKTMRDDPSDGPLPHQAVLSIQDLSGIPTGSIRDLPWLGHGALVRHQRSYKKELLTVSLAAQTNSNINKTDIKSNEKWRKVSSNTFKYKQNWHQIHWRMKKSIIKSIQI